MADKKTVLLESISKLKKLNVSDEEIVSYLKEFGIPEPYIRSLLLGPEGVPKDPSAVVEKNAAVSDEPLEAPEVGDLKVKFFRQKHKSASDSSKATVPFVKGKKHSKQSVEPMAEEDDEKSPVLIPAAVSAKETGMSSLWEKGILNTVTDSVIEIKKIRDELDSVMEARFEKGLEKETKKVAGLLENTQVLMIAKVNSQLDKKTREITDLLDERIAELKKSRDELRAEQDSFKMEKKIASDLFRQLSDELVKSKELRDRSLTQFNTDLIKSKSDISLTLDDARQKMLVIEERATKTLQLETAIIEGMIKDAGNRIDRMTIAKVTSLAGNLEEKINSVSSSKSPDLDYQELQLQIENLKVRINKVEADLPKEKQ